MRSFGLSLTIACGAVLAVGLRWPAPPASRAPSPAAETARREAVVRAHNGLRWAQRKARHALDGDLAPLDELFAGVKQRTPEFARVVLGWGSKWRFVADKTPFTKGGHHAAFLRQAFEEHLFKPDELTRAIEQVARAYADDLSAIENRMLVRIREDVSDLPAAALPEFASQRTLLAAYEAALERTGERVGDDVHADVATQIASLVAGEVMTQIAVRLGVSAGILSVGAGSSWATLGAGVAIGLIVDQLVSWVWQWWADPSGSLAAELNDKLDELHRLIVEGDESTKGLRGGLEDFAARRARVRRAAVLSLVISH